MHKLITVILTNGVLLTLALSSVLAVEETTNGAVEVQGGLGVFALILGVLAIFFISVFTLGRANGES